MNLFNYHILGVLNRTPDSFSDHGKSLESGFFKAQVKSHLEHKNLILDVGFESTGLMNAAISFDEEMKRFQAFLLALAENELVEEIKNSGVISFDTYRPKSFFEMTKISDDFFGKHMNYIFNDVSGVLDEELRSTLRELKSTLIDRFYYVYNFTQIPERGSVLEHPKFINSKDPLKGEVLRKFQSAYDFMSELSLERALILDFGFGFSKSYEQNWELIELVSEIINELSAQKGPYLIGLSKKSFLRQKLSVTDPKLTEELHRDLICELRAKSPTAHLIFRVHDPKIY